MKHLTTATQVWGAIGGKITHNLRIPIRSCLQNSINTAIWNNGFSDVRSHVWNSVGVSVRAPVENSVRDIFDQI